MNKNRISTRTKLTSIYLLIFSIFLVISREEAAARGFHKGKDGVTLQVSNGTLAIYPVADNAVRVTFTKDTLAVLPELIFVREQPVPAFKVEESASALKVILKNMQVIVEKSNGKLSYADLSGSVFLNEVGGQRKLDASSIAGQACYVAEQSFESPDDESIFGLGQFQDGNFNLKGITRSLTQVNTQIALPFIYSSKGYGLLWHEYGLTDFNPTENFVELTKQQKAGEENQLVEVTTTSGTQKVSQNQSFYTGTFRVEKDGEYSVFLDLGNMGNRHFVTIDGKPCLDESNMWLPPTAGTLVELSAGEHQVQLICKADNQPKLSWKLVDNTTTFRSPVTKKLDYVVFYGPSADKVISTYRNLSGSAPMLPKWAYGFWQCRERYSSSNQLIETVQEFRNRKLPMDVIVQDWQYWGKNGWGVPQFDESNYPNPSGFIKQLHDLNAHFNISIWSNPDQNSEIGKAYVAEKRFIPNTKWLDYFNPETRKAYWNTLKNNMFDNGVDSWWMDAVEPENDALKGETTYAGLGDFYRLTYPLMVSKAVYEGQREATSDKRVCILTRSAFLGQQRYGVINWSGDIGGNWDSYRRQIVAGLNYTITGIPYWTTDIGGFFRPGPSQYSDEKYHELLIRWFQWGAFNPVFRIHGYMSETEPWKYGQVVEDDMRKMLNLRYQMLPYIYSEAWQVTENGSTLMRPLVMDFRDDSVAIAQTFEYLFGKSILVAPVTEPMTREKTVYLPKASGWYDFWTGEKLKGGQTVIKETPLDIIPLYVKAGSILPIGSKVQYASEQNGDNLEVRIYEGANGEFTLYEDENDGYDYEKGVYSAITFRWNDTDKTLTIEDRKGSYPGMLVEQTFNIVKVSENKGAGDVAVEKYDKTITYNGEKTIVKL